VNSLGCPTLWASERDTVKTHQFGLLSALILASTAHATITFTSQTRTITAGGSFLTPSTASAPDFAPWNQTVNLFSLDGNNGGKAQQNSSLLSNPSSMSQAQNGVICGVALSAYDGLQTYSGNASSLLDVTFTLDAQATYDVGGQGSGDL